MDTSFTRSLPPTDSRDLLLRLCHALGLLGLGWAAKDPRPTIALMLCSVAVLASLALLRFRGVVGRRGNSMRRSSKVYGKDARPSPL